MQPGDRLPVIYLADGLGPELAGVADALWRSGAIAPFLLVGIQSFRQRGDLACSPRCDDRSREYLVNIPDLPPEQSRFEAHARFVIEEVIPLIERTFPVSRWKEDRVTAGFSSGAAWAVSMVVRNPDLFGRSIAMSLGWLPAAEAAQQFREGQLFIGGGRLEDRFYERSVLAARNAARAGARVRLRTPNAGHSYENWTILFDEALRWHFPPARR
jgi:enterochelin esterase-like enzyme